MKKISQETSIELYKALSELVCAICPPTRKKNKTIIDVDGVESYFKEPIEKSIEVLNRVRKEIVG